MANFLLATVILGLMALSGNALRVSARTRGELSALTLAHSQLAELRQNLQATPTPVSAWPTLSGLGSWHNHPDFAASEYRLDVALQPDYSPYWRSELMYPLSERRSLDASAVRARAQARWAGGTVSLVTLIADRRRQWRTANPIEITSVPSAGGSVPKGGHLGLSVQAFNSGGTSEPDALFTWSVMPGTSTGMILSQSRDGRQAVFAHQVPKRSGVGFISGPAGTCYIVATSRLWGQERSQRLLVNLQ